MVNKHMKMLSISVIINAKELNYEIFISLAMSLSLCGLGQAHL